MKYVGRAEIARCHRQTKSTLYAERVSLANDEVLLAIAIEITYRD